MPEVLPRLPVENLPSNRTTQRLLRDGMKHGVYTRYLGQRWHLIGYYRNGDNHIGVYARKVREPGVGWVYSPERLHMPMVGDAGYCIRVGK